eukprot:s3945_g9.t1
MQMPGPPAPLQGAEPAYDAGGVEAWENVGTTPVSPATEVGQGDSLDVIRGRIQDLGGKIKDAASRVSLEEVESYWQVMPGSIRDLVSEGGEVVPDLLTYIADDDAERMELLRQHGCPEEELKDKATVLEALQLISEETSKRLRRNRVAKRGAQRAFDESLKVKMAKSREDALKLQEGEIPTKRWLESCLEVSHCRGGGGVQTMLAWNLMLSRRSKSGSRESGNMRPLRSWRFSRGTWTSPLSRVPRVQRCRRNTSGASLGHIAPQRSGRESENGGGMCCGWRLRWPSKRIHALDYFSELRTAGAPFSVPQSFATTLAFFERAAAIPSEEVISRDPAVKRALDYTNKTLEEERPEKRQAPLLPLRVIAAMELLVVNEEEPTFLRFASWTKLDPQGVDFEPHR